MKDVVIVGAGVAGMATAARLQASGLSTLALEAHGQPGGCAGFYRRKGFAFDVGATTLVDFEPDGVGGELLRSIGMKAFHGEALPGYRAWLPDRTVTLFRGQEAWHQERLRRLGSSTQHRDFWKLLDSLADVFWNASRQGIKLPVQSPMDLLRDIAAIGVSNLHLGRYLNWTMADALRHFGLRDDAALCGLLAMLIEDTVHSNLQRAPLINSALGITIRGAGLSRHKGGMFGFWRTFLAHYRALGGEIRFASKVEKIEGSIGNFCVHTRRGDVTARQIVCAVPPETAASIAPPPVGQALKPYLERDAGAKGGAIIVCLGIKETEVEGQEFTHHQLLQDYSCPLGNGNNMFVSVSSPGDTESAPSGYLAAMISTHCELNPWLGLTEEAYEAQKERVGADLVSLARRVYPELGKNPVVIDVGTPRTYARFTGRLHGAVGGVRQNLQNANQNAVPHQLGQKGIWLVGDGTWPGLGTVACVLGSRIVTDGVLRAARSHARILVPRDKQTNSEVKHGSNAQPNASASQIG